MAQAIIYPLSSFATDHDRLVHSLIRHYSHALRMEHRQVSCRLIDDLAYFLVQNMLDAEIPIEEIINLPTEKPSEYGAYLDAAIKWSCHLFINISIFKEPN